MRDGMIPPDALLKFSSANVRSYCAALRSVEPTVRSTGQRVRQRVGVIHAKSAQQHLGIAIGHIIMIPVRIEEQIGRLHNKHTTVTNGQSRTKIQIAQKIFELVSLAIAVGVLTNGDAIRPFWPARG